MEQQSCNFNIGCFILYSSRQHDLLLWELSWFPTKCIQAPLLLSLIVIQVEDFNEMFI